MFLGQAGYGPLASSTLESARQAACASGQASQIDKQQAGFIPVRVDELNRLSVAGVKAGPPDLVPAKDFGEAALQNGNIKRTRHAQSNAFVVKRRNAVRTSFAQPK